MYAENIKLLLVGIKKNSVRLRISSIHLSNTRIIFRSMSGIIIQVTMCACSGRHFDLSWRYDVKQKNKTNVVSLSCFGMRIRIVFQGRTRRIFTKNLTAESAQAICKRSLPSDVVFLPFTLPRICDQRTDRSIDRSMDLFAGSHGAVKLRAKL